MEAMREAISGVKSNVYIKNGNKGKQAGKMLSYFTSKLSSSKYPECNNLSPLEYANLMNSKKIVTRSMIRELEREIRTCKERIEESSSPSTDTASSGSSDMSDATSSLIDSQISILFMPIAVLSIFDENQWTAYSFKDRFDRLYG